MAMCYVAAERIKATTVPNGSDGVSVCHATPANNFRYHGRPVFRGVFSIA